MFSVIFFPCLFFQVTGQLGSTITVDYNRVGNTAEDPHSHWVVSQVTEDDGIAENGNPSTFKYSYGPGVWDFRGINRHFSFVVLIVILQNALSADSHPWPRVWSVIRAKFTVWTWKIIRLIAFTQWDSRIIKPSTTATITSTSSTSIRISWFQRIL